MPLAHLPAPRCVCHALRRGMRLTEDHSPGCLQSTSTCATFFNASNAEDIAGISSINIINLADAQRARHAATSGAPRSTRDARIDGVIPLSTTYLSKTRALDTSWVLTFVVAWFLSRGRRRGLGGLSGAHACGVDR